MLQSPLKLQFRLRSVHYAQPLQRLMFSFSEEKIFLRSLPASTYRNIFSLHDSSCIYMQQKNKKKQRGNIIKGLVPTLTIERWAVLSAGSSKHRLRCKTHYSINTTDIISLLGSRSSWGQRVQNVARPPLNSNRGTAPRSIGSMQLVHSNQSRRRGLCNMAQRQCESSFSQEVLWY